jgi:hypothetical protein
MTGAAPGDQAKPARPIFFSTCRWTNFLQPHYLWPNGDAAPPHNAR